MLQLEQCKGYCYFWVGLRGKESDITIKITKKIIQNFQILFKTFLKSVSTNQYLFHEQNSNLNKNEPMKEKSVKNPNTIYELDLQVILGTYIRFKKRSV
jgi:hypothetical protein